MAGGNMKTETPWLLVLLLLIVFGVASYLQHQQVVDARKQLARQEESADSFNRETIRQLSNAETETEKLQAALYRCKHRK
jgi:uncharacterized protein HemX